MDFVNNFLDLDFEGMKYRFFIPKSETKKLILHMHGSAGRGNDNIKNLNYMDAAGFHTVIDKNLAFILVPQVQENKKFFENQPLFCQFCLGHVGRLVNGGIGTVSA